MIEKTIYIVGLGGIGSWTASKVARIGCRNLVLLDPDVVEPRNIMNQDYLPQHIGMTKVLAQFIRLQEIATYHSNNGEEMSVRIREERATRHTAFHDIVVVAVDSAEARRDIFAACRYNGSVSLYIEAGAAENQGVVRALVPHKKEHVLAYEKILRSLGSGQNAPAACVSEHMGGQFASIITHWIRAHWGGWIPKHIQESIIDYRSVPRLDTYDSL